MIDRAKFSRTLCEVPDLSILDMKLDAVAIVPRFARDYADLARELDLANAAQYLAQDVALLFQLERIIDVLILAAAAALEIGAGGVMREAEGCWTSITRPRHRSFFARSVSARTTSPGSTKGVRTTLPSWRASPSPPYTSFSIVRVSSTGKRKGTMVVQQR